MIVHGLKPRTIRLSNLRVTKTAFQTPMGVQECELLEIETTDPNLDRKKGRIEVRSISFQELDELVEARARWERGEQVDVPVASDDEADVEALDQDEPAAAE